jgi:hypothetical protein
LRFFPSAGALLPTTARDPGHHQEWNESTSGDFQQICVFTVSPRFQASYPVKTRCCWAKTTLSGGRSPLSSIRAVWRSFGNLGEVHRVVYMIGFDRDRLKEVRLLASSGESESFIFTGSGWLDKLIQCFLSFANFCPHYLSPQNSPFLRVLRSSVSADLISVFFDTLYTLTAEIGARRVMDSIAATWVRIQRFLHPNRVVYSGFSEVYSRFQSDLSAIWRSNGHWSP